MKRFFEFINDGENRLFILQNGQRFDTRTGMPNNTLDVWKTGKFNYVGLKPEAAELFAKETVTEVIRLINQSKRVEDIKVLASAKSDSPNVQKAAENRINHLTNTSK